MGFPIAYLDVGGGLGVDYDGSRSAFDSSTNYTLQEYTNDVVFYIADVCNAEKVPHPNIVSESGRAIVAHHSVLIVEVFGAIEKIRPGEFLKFGDNEHRARQGTARHQKKPRQGEQTRGLPRRAGTQARTRSTCSPSACWICPTRRRSRTSTGKSAATSSRVFKGQAYVPEEIRKLEDSLGDQYLCNFSVFQSLLDHWALGQLFPIMPIARLKNARRAKARWWTSPAIPTGR